MFCMNLDMPKSTKAIKKRIHDELQKWLAQSRRMKGSSHCSYSKIKGNLLYLESNSNKEELQQLSSNIGKIKSQFNLITKCYNLETVIEKIGKNTTECLEQLQNDIENLESTAPPKAPRKKARRTVSKKDLSKCLLDMEAQEGNHR